MAQNKVSINIAGINLIITTPEDEEYVLQLAQELDTFVSTVLEKTPGASVTNAILLCAVEYLDEYKKANRTANNMRSQIKDYMSEAANAKLQYDQEVKRVSELETEIQTLRNHLTRIAAEGDASGVMSKLQQDTSQAHAELEQLRKRNEDLTEQNKTLAEKTDAMNNYISDQEREIARLTAVTEELTVRLDDHGDASPEMTKKMEQYEAQIHDLILETERLKSELEILESMIDEERAGQTTLFEEPVVEGTELNDSGDNAVAEGVSADAQPDEPESDIESEPQEPEQPEDPSEPVLTDTETGTVDEDVIPENEAVEDVLTIETEIVEIEVEVESEPADTPPEISESEIESADSEIKHEDIPAGLPDTPALENAGTPQADADLATLEESAPPEENPIHSFDIPLFDDDPTVLDDSSTQSGSNSALSDEDLDIPSFMDRTSADVAPLPDTVSDTPKTEADSVSAAEPAFPDEKTASSTQDNVPRILPDPTSKMAAFDIDLSDLPNFVDQDTPSGDVFKEYNIDEDDTILGFGSVPRDKKLEDAEYRRMKAEAESRSDTENKDESKPSEPAAPLSETDSMLQRIQQVTESLEKAEQDEQVRETTSAKKDSSASAPKKPVQQDPVPEPETPADKDPAPKDKPDDEKKSDKKRKPREGRLEGLLNDDDDDMPNLSWTLDI